MQFYIWLGFALAAPALWAINNVMDRIFITKLVKNEYALTFAAGALRIFYFLAAWAVADFFVPGFKEFLWAFFSGFLCTLAIVFYLKALQRERTVPAMLAYDAANPLLVLFLSAVLLHERLSYSSAAGFFVLLFAGLLSSVKFGEKIVFRRGVLFMLVAVLLWGTSDVATKYLMPFFPSPTALLAWTMLGGFAGAFIMLAIPSFKNKCQLKEFAWGFRIWAVFTAVAVLSFIGFLFFFKAIAIGSVSLTTVVSNVQVLFIFALEAILFYASRFLPIRLRIFEKVDFGFKSLAPKAVSFVLIVVGIWLLQI